MSKSHFFTKVLGNFLSHKSYGADILHVDVPLCYLKKIMKERCRQIKNGRLAAILNVKVWSTKKNEKQNIISPVHNLLT